MKEKKTVKVLFAIPNEDGVLVDAYDNRLISARHLGALEVLSHFGVKEYGGQHWDFPDDVQFEFHQATIGNVLTPVARERIAEIAVGEKFDYIFFVDDDMICPRDLFERLYKHQKDIVAALAFTRFAPHRPVLYLIEEGYDQVAKKNYYTSKSYFNYPKDTLVQCDAVGFGAVLIKVDVFNKLQQPWFTPGTGRGEDIQFCYDAGKAGYKVYMDTATKLGHLGPPKVIDEAVYEKETDNKELRKVYGSPLKYEGEEVESC